MKVRPFYDRSDLVRLTIDTVEHNLLVGHDAGPDRADLFPGQLSRGHHRRADDPAQPALRVHLVARARRARQPALDRRDRFRDHHRRHRGDDGKHLPRTGRTRTGRTTNCTKSSSRRRATWTGPFFIPSRSSSPDTFPSTPSPALPGNCSFRWRRRCLTRCWAR